MKHIPYGKQSINQADIDVVAETMQSDWLTQGPKVDEFERALCNLTGAKYCTVVSNGTIALYIGCLALGLAPGKSGLTSPISFMASSNCIEYCGATSGFCDISSDDLCLSTDALAALCEDGHVPDVAIPVDFAGVPADLPRFKDLSRKYGFSLIEDAAHSIGSTYRYGGCEFACGSCEHTDLAIFSFHPVKTITTGEGGAILTNDPQIAEKLQMLANHGIQRNPEKYTGPGEVFREAGQPAGAPMNWYHEMQLLGMNARLTDLQCALGLSQLEKLPVFKEKRKTLVERYNLAFKELAASQKVILPPWPQHSDPCCHLYPLRVGPASSVNRDALFNHLKSSGIFCQIHYIPIYRQPYYTNRYPYQPGDFPVAEAYFKTCLSLPLYPDLDDDSFDRVVTEIMAWVRR